MKKYLIFLALILSHFSIHAEGVKLSCIPDQPACVNCPEYRTLFPIEEFSTSIDSLDIEADQSEILEGKYLLKGNVKVNSENLYLSADNVDVSSIDNSLLATGNVRFQDEAYLIAGDLLTATRDQDENLIAKAKNANYQDFGAGIGGANGYTESISKTSSSVLLKNSTYSLCPVNKNDWLIDADQIELNLIKNRGVANNALVKFYGVPIFYLPKYSWVLSGRGSGFLTPDYSSYEEPGQKDGSYSIRVPYYFNLAPDKDLLVALTYMTSRRFIYEGKYRQLIAPKISPEHEDSIWQIEAKYLPEDKVTSLKRWLFNFSDERDISEKIHLNANYYRVSDKDYFKEIARTNTNILKLNSSLKLSYIDLESGLSTHVLTEAEQVVNAGEPGYTKVIEGSIGKNFNPKRLDISTSLVATKFAHKTESKESGTRTHSGLGVSTMLNVDYPKIKPKASVTNTNYSLKNSKNINRIIFGTGLDIDFTFNKQTTLFGYEVNRAITPLITYNYRAKKIQGNIPIFDSTDKYDDIVTFAALTSGERYTGLDRISNANDITLSLSSGYRANDALKEDKDLLNIGIAQTYYTDDEVVSDSVNTNYETRKSYSDIATGIALSLNNYSIISNLQFNSDTYKIVKKENKFSYQPSSRKFVSFSLVDKGSETTDKLYGAIPLTDSIHFFGGFTRNKVIKTSVVVKTETTGLAYESCCWAFRIAHFKEGSDSNPFGKSYSTGMELVLTGLGSSSSPLKGKIEGNIPGYKANLW